MDRTGILGFVRKLPVVGGTVGDIADLIEAGTQLADIISSNIEAAKGTISEDDAAKLRAQAASLADRNRELSGEVDRALGG